MTFEWVASFPTASAVAYFFARRMASLLPVRLSTATTTERPARRWPLSSAAFGRAMRTGRRWITLVKLPVAFSGGSSENTAPEAGASEETVPSKLWPSIASTVMHRA